MACVHDAALAGRRPAVVQIVLASASPARLALLRSAGIEPQVVVSDVDEDAVARGLGVVVPVELCLALAKAKARAVAAHIDMDDAVVVGCDSVLDVDGVAYGKPASSAAAKERWLSMRGRSGVLHTGHWLVNPGSGAELGAVASTTVFHGAPTEHEIDAYVATGEPMRVAGGFTLDGLGAPFVDRIDGDPSNVIGLSLPLLRRLLADMGVVWTDLWAPRL